MKETTRDGVEITLDKPRRLRFDMNSVCDLEVARNQQPFPEILRDFDAGSFSALRDLLWVGLKWEDRTLTPAKAGDLLQAKINQGETVKPAYLAIAEALKQSFAFTSAATDPSPSTTS